MNATLSPEQLSKEGQAAYRRGEYLQAAEAYAAAAQGFGQAGQALEAAELANNASVAYLQGDDAEAALQIVAGTPETFAAAGDLRRQGLALGNRGAALEALGSKDEALQAYQESAGALKQAGDDVSRAAVMQSLSALQLKTGRRLEALATMQAGLDGLKRPSPRQRLIRRLLDAPFQMMKR